MRFLAISYFLAPFCFASIKAVAQVNVFPGPFGQVMLAKQLLNPAMANMERASNLTFSNRFYTGPYSKIDRLYCIGNVNLNKKDSARYVNSVGVKFVNEKEGEFVERPKYYLSYSVRTRLYDNYWLGLGIEIGRAGYMYKGTDVSTAGSSSNWDGNIGLVFYNPKFCVGGGVNQFFNSLVLPKDLYFRWTRFYSLFAERKIDIGSSHLSLYAQNQFLPHRRDILDLGAYLTLAKLVFVGSNVWVGRTVSFIVGLKNVSLDEHHFSLYMSYNMPASSQASTNIQSFEMSLYYQFR